MSNMLNSYPSISNLNKDRYVILEKIHGQNLSFRVTDNNPNLVEVRTRNVVDGEYEGKLGLESCSLVTSEIANEIIILINYFINSDEFGNFTNLVIYGELFGGYYGNKKGSKRIIQHGISYDTEHRFLVFDIMINDEFLPYGRVDHILHTVGIKTIPIFYKGNNLLDVLNKANELKNTQDSLVYSLYNNEKLENNKVEGVVVRKLDSIPEFRVKFVSDNFNEVKKSISLDKSEVDEVFDKIKESFNIGLIIDKCCGKLNIDLCNSDDKTRYKEVITMLIDEIKEELTTVDEKVIKKVAGKLFSDHLRDGMFS